MVSIFNRMSHILDEEKVSYDNKVIAELVARQQINCGIFDIRYSYHVALHVLTVK